jgi:hypothetical protein
MNKIKKIILNFFSAKKMKTEKQRGKQRKIDQAVKKTTEGLGWQFAVISRREVKAWRAYLIIFFVAGFFSALIIGAYNRWYVQTKADIVPVVMSVVTDTDTHKAGDQYTDQILLDTGGQNVVAVQSIATYDKTKVQIVSIDDSASDFPNEIKKEDDSENGKIFVALAKPTPGVNSVRADIATVTIKVLADFTGSALAMKFDTPAAVDDSAAILDDGNGTNILTQVKNVVTNPTPPPSTDTNPPVISGGAPSGELASGTTTTTLRVLTNENATCKYSDTSGKSYADMSNTFSSTGAKNHTTSLTGLADGKSYDYYVRCIDTAGNADINDYHVSFSVVVGGSKNTEGPAITKSSPSGTLASGTKGITIKVATNVAATCKYSTTAGTTFANMSDKFSKTGGTTSSTRFNGLSDGNEYNIYVRCQDDSGNTNTEDYNITFSVEGSNSDTTPPTMSEAGPSGSLESTTTSVTLTVKTNEPSTCKYDTKSFNYKRLSNTFSNTGGTDHTSSVSVESGQSYRYYVRCEDEAGNDSSGFVMINFSVQ